mgnify:CR=1 FL=1
MTDYLRLVRWKNLLIIGLTQLFFIYLTKAQFLEFKDIALIISTLLTAAGGYVINDFYDLEADKINKPNKVFIGKTIPKDHSRRFYFLLVILALWIGYYAFGPNTTYILYINVLLFLYSYRLKRWPLIGNIAVSICTAMVIYFLFITNPVIYLYLSNGVKKNSLMLLTNFTIFAFLISMVRELIKDIEDIDGDKKVGYKTLPIITNTITTKVLSIITIVLLNLAYWDYIQCMEYVSIIPKMGYYLILLSSLFLVYKIVKANNKVDYSKISSYCKILMLVGMGTAVLWFI